MSAPASNLPTPIILSEIVIRLLSDCALWWITPRFLVAQEFLGLCQYDPEQTRRKDPYFTPTPGLRAGLRGILASLRIVNRVSLYRDLRGKMLRLPPVSLPLFGCGTSHFGSFEALDNNGRLCWSNQISFPLGMPSAVAG